MLWAILIVLFISLVIYLLFTSLSVFIDTSANRYCLELKGIFSINAESHASEILIFRLHIFFFDFIFYPLRPNKKKKIKTKKKYKKSKFFLTFKQVYRIIKSCKIKRFFMDIDTGDCITNARLYPAFALLNYKGANFNINFEGRNKLVVHIQNRPIYIIKSFINL
jgi:integrase